MTLLTKPHVGRLGILAVTLLQCFPPSRVTDTTPSLLLIQITPRSIGDSAIAVRVQGTSWPSGPIPAGLFCLLMSFVVRSGLITVHVLPPSAATASLRVTGRRPRPSAEDRARPHVDMLHVRTALGTPGHPVGF